MKYIELINRTYSGIQYVSNKIILTTPHEASKSDWLNNHYDKNGDIYYALYERVDNMLDNTVVYAVNIDNAKILSNTEIINMVHRAEDVIITDITE